MVGRYAYLMKTTKPHNRSKTQRNVRTRNMTKRSRTSVIAAQKCEQEEISAAAGGTVYTEGQTGAAVCRGQAAPVQY